MSTTLGPINGFMLVLRRDLRVSLRRRSDTFSTLIFFVMVTSLFPLGVGPEPQLLRTMAPGVLWVAAMLASMLSLPRLFADDHSDGTLEQMLLSTHSLPWLVLGKTLAHWVGSGLPLVLLSPVLALQFDLSASATGVLVVLMCCQRRRSPAILAWRRSRRNTITSGVGVADSLSLPGSWSAARSTSRDKAHACAPSSKPLASKGAGRLNWSSTQARGSS